MAGWIRKLASPAAALIVALALLAAVKELPSSLRATDKRIAENAGLSLEDRELAVPRAYGVNGSLAVRAAEVLPRDAVFYVATGDAPAAVAAAPFYAYWLLPRRHTDDEGRAGWIVDFGADPATLPANAHVVADLGGGAEILRVRR